MNHLCRQHKFRSIGIIFMCLFFVSCGASGGEDSSSAGGGSNGTTTINISVSASSQSIAADGTSQTSITAAVTDKSGANVADGTQVTFSTTAGSLSAASAATGGGIASVTLTSPLTAGSATVTASSQGASGTVTVNFTPGPIANITLNATPANLTANGTSTSTVQALATDANGNLANDGELISFGIVSGSGSLSSPSATTSGGSASVTYTASNTPGIETIQAQAGSGVSATTNITLVTATAGSVSLSAGTSSLVANGVSFTMLRATVLDSVGNNVSDGTVVTFTTTAGDLDGATPGNQMTINSSTVNGVATAQLTSATSIGSATATATVSGLSDTTVITFTPGPVAVISLTATPSNLTADGTSTSAIRAMVLDTNANPVSDSTTLVFNVTSGTGTLSSLAATTSGGIATVIYTASNTAGIETLQATATNGTTATVNITLIGATVRNVSVSTATGSIVANGVDSTLIYARVTDTGGNIITDGTPVNFTASAGTLSAASAETFGGNASVILTSATTVGPSLITATAGGVSSSATVSFTAGAADGANTTLSASPGVIPADAASISQVTLAAADANGNPVVDGTTVSFTTTAGSLSAAAASTTNGRANVNLTSSTSNETATVAAVIGTVTRTVTVVFGTGAGSGEPANIIISIDPESIQVQGTGGVSRTTITGTVVDENGAPYNDSTDNIRFTLQSGLNGGEYLVDASGNPQTTITKSTSGGIAAVSLQAGTVSGPVTILVQVLKDGTGAVLGSAISALSPPILIEPGAPSSMTLFPASDVLDNENGTLSRIYAAMLQDQLGNPVANDTGVYFGIVDNPPNGHLTSNTNGATNGTTTFTSVGTDFATAGVDRLDRLIILEGRDEGGHLVDAPANGSVTLIYSLSGTETGLDFVAGNAQLGTICTVVSTGNQIPDTNCAPATGVAVKGVAHSRLTWSGSEIFKPFYLYAESEDPGLSLGQARSSTYWFFKPAIIDVSLIPASSVAGGTTVTVSAHLHDSASPFNNLSNQTLHFAINNTTDAGFGVIGNGTTTSVTGQNGIAQATLATNAGAAAVDLTATYTTATGETFTGTATLTLN